MKGKILALILVASVFIILVSTLFAAAPLPRFCGFCHGKDYQTWAKSSHRQTKCHLCHQQPGLLGFSIQRIKLLRMVGSYTTGLYERPVIANVPVESCRYCHPDIEQKTVVKRSIRVSHKELQQRGYQCTFCHNTIAHGNAVPSKKLVEMRKCVVCHDGTTASSRCDLCHAKQVKREIGALKGSWGIIHGTKWQKTHGLGDPTTCRVCHGTGFCANCHGIDLPHPASWPNLHGEIAVKLSQNCLQCHRQEFCRSCHRIEMPHPDSILPEHSRLASRQGTELCYSCHNKPGCEVCHERHIHPAVPGVKPPGGR